MSKKNKKVKEVKIKRLYFGWCGDLNDAVCNADLPISNLTDSLEVEKQNITDNYDSGTEVTVYEITIKAVKKYEVKGLVEIK